MEISDETIAEIKAVREADDNYVIIMNNNKEIDVGYRSWYEPTDDCLLDERFHTEEDAQQCLSDIIQKLYSKSRQDELFPSQLLSVNVLRKYFKKLFEEFR